MNLDEYQNFVDDMTLHGASNFEYGVTNLCSEAGEVAAIYAKTLRDKGGGCTDITFYRLVHNEALKKELGDVLFMVTLLCTQAGFTLDEVMQTNVEKLRSRRDRGTIGGSGDDR